MGMSRVESHRSHAKRRMGTPVRISATMALLSLLALVGGQASAQANQADCTVPPPPALSFEWPVYVDAQLSGGEPTSIVAKDGSIEVGAHYGTTLIDTKAVPDPNWIFNYRNQTL